MKNMESIFREEGRKITMEPSAQAWRKLENKLDQQRPEKGKVVLMRQWMAVAASLLVLFVSLQLWDRSASPAYDYIPTFVEEIEDNPGCQPYCMLIEMRKELPGFYAVPGKDELKDHS